MRLRRGEQMSNCTNFINDINQTLENLLILWIENDMPYQIPS